MNRVVHCQWRRTSILSTHAVEGEVLFPILRLSDDRLERVRQWREHAEPGDFSQPTSKTVVVCVKGNEE
jgi:hypothetical protein